MIRIFFVVAQGKSGHGDDIHVLAVPCNFDGLGSNLQSCTCSVFRDSEPHFGSCKTAIAMSIPMDMARSPSC